jgi:Ca2+-binding EF-hand superfamily protein
VAARALILTRVDHRARLASAFQRQDRNGDGVLDPRELAAPPR